MKFFVLLCLCVLVACGADGPPTKPGLTFTGEMKVGVANTPDIIQ